MKKIIALLFSLLIITSAVSVCAEENENTISSKAEEASALLCALSDNAIFNQTDNANVTRAEYITAIGEIVGNRYTVPEEKVFSDVSESAVYAPYVYWALDSGWISEANLFRPDDEITLNEAVKIAVSAMRLSEYAQIMGGYPYGYMAAANDFKLLRHIKMGEYLTKSDMAVLLYNMLTAELLSIENIVGEQIYYEYAGKTLLYELYKIKITEGIITQTQTASFNAEYSYNKRNNNIAVDGQSYESKIDVRNYFGMNCKVFYEDDSAGRVIAVCPVENNELELEIDDISDFDGTRLEAVSSEGRKKTYKIKKSYIEVYNGKVKTPSTEDITSLSGRIRLLDNDDDGIYDILFINHYTYSKVRNTDIAGRIIEDEYSSDNNISIDDENVFFSITDSDENILKASEISAGDILEILKSEDGTVVEITVLKNPVSAQITSVNPSEDKVTIEGVDYSISDYVKSYCSDRFRAGIGVEVYIGRSGEIAYVYFSGQSYTYGFMVKVFEEEDSDRYFINIFTSSGEFKNCKMADKLMLNGGNKQSSERVFTVLKTDFTPQLIRYKTDKDGGIISVDTAEDCIIDSSLTVEEWEKERDEDNKLTRFDFGQSSYMFRSNYCFGTSFNAIGATVFMVPVLSSNSDEIDTSNKEDFEIIDISAVRTGFAYSYFDVYDVNEFGTASVLVGKNVARTGTPYSFISTVKLKSNSGMISNIVKSVNDEGETGQLVEIWTNGSFSEYFLPDDITCAMAPGTELEEGDIIRYRADREEIKEIILDFDYSTFESNYEYNSASAQLNRGNSTLTYQAGKLYNFDDNFCTYSNTEIGSKYDFAPINLMNSHIKTNNICAFDGETKTVETITYQQLRSHKVYEEDADYVLIKQDGLVTQCIYVYRKGGK